MENRENIKLMIGVAKPEDAEGVAQVFYQTWLATYPNEKYGITKEDIEERFKSRLSKEGVEKMARQIENLEPDSLFLVAKAEDRVVGVCRARKNENINELSAIYVFPDYQGQGLGYKLWQEIQKFFDPNKDIVVNVATYNHEAIYFYQKLGFVDTGEQTSKEVLKLKSGAVIPETKMIIKR